MFCLQTAINNREKKEKKKGLNEHLKKCCFKFTLCRQKIYKYSWIHKEID